MFFRCVLLISLSIALAANTPAAPANKPDELESLAAREAFFSAYQKEWFDAITRLGDAPKRLAADRDQGFETVNIDFEISYRMSRRDGRELLSDIARISDDEARNELYFRLANVFYRKGLTGDALRALQQISGTVKPGMAGDLEFFRAQVLIASDRYGDAIAILNELNTRKPYLGFASFNLGVAYLLTGNREEGLRQLDLAGQINSDGAMPQAIRDKANLTLGEELLNEGDYGQAGMVLDRIRLEGPYSTEALLFAGWSSVLQKDCENALVPWTLLAERESTDAAVQDAMLAVPYCYGKLGLHGKAANLYSNAVNTFEAEIEKLGQSIASVQDGRLLDSLRREEMQLDANWAVKLRALPDTPETYYLLDLIASHPFQEALQNYLDLKHMAEYLDRWKQDLPAYAGLIKNRRSHYEPLLPSVDAEFNKLKVRMQQLYKQRDMIGQQLGAMKAAPRPFLLATEEERTFLKDIDEIDRMMGPYHVVKTRARIERLRGMIYWSMYSAFDQRLIAAQANFKRLDSAIQQLTKQYDSFVLIRNAVAESYSGYEDPLASLEKRIEAVQGEIVVLIERQARQLNELAVEELMLRREQIKEMQVKARYAMADSYDRATMGRETEGGAQ